MALLRRFFVEREFLEVETPVLCSSPGVEAHLDALETRLGRRPMYLTTSPEFHMKRLVASGIAPIFQVTRAFRAGEAGPRHNPEFTIVEWYRARADYRAIMDDCEALLAALARGLRGESSSPALEGTRQSLELSGPYPRTMLHAAFREAGVVGPEEMSVEERDRLLVDLIEPRLGRRKPEFLMDYPVDQASLAKLREGTPPVAERFELYAAGLELANGFTEITDPREFIERCDEALSERRRLGLPEYPTDRRYVEMLREGLPPCAGVALGFDRVVMLLAGVADIRDCMAFPIEQA